MSAELTKFEPSTVDELMKFSDWLSKSQLIPRALQKRPADIALVLMRGRDLRISSLQALACINVIDGKTVLSAELLMALCVREVFICEYFRLVESTPQKATYEAKRKGSESVRLSYTIQEAQAAGLTGKDNWKKHPPTMLRWRCISGLAKTVFPDLTMGIYTPDEAEEIAGPTPTPERELNATPIQIEPPKEEPKQPKTSRLKEKLKARIVDVQPGQTEAEAEQMVFLGEPEPPSLTDQDAPPWGG